MEGETETETLVYDYGQNYQQFPSHSAWDAPPTYVVHPNENPVLEPAGIDDYSVEFFVDSFWVWDDEARLKWMFSGIKNPPHGDSWIARATSDDGLSQTTTRWSAAAAATHRITSTTTRSL